MSDTPRTNAVVGDFNFPWSYQMEMLVRHAEQLERELDAALKDAKRYRWLRDKSIGQYQHPIAVQQRRVEHGMQYIGPLCWEDLDKEIDAAIAAAVIETVLGEDQ